jgi:hypothetical protein
MLSISSNNGCLDSINCDQRGGQNYQRYVSIGSKQRRDMGVKFVRFRQIEYNTTQHNTRFFFIMATSKFSVSKVAFRP